MTEKDENVIDVGNEEFIDSEEWKDNFLKQGKWIRLFGCWHSPSFITWLCPSYG